MRVSPWGWAGSPDWPARREDRASKRRLPRSQRLRALTAVASRAGAPRMSNRIMEGPKEGRVAQMPNSSPRGPQMGLETLGCAAPGGSMREAVTRPSQAVTELWQEFLRRPGADGTSILWRGGAHTCNGFAPSPSPFLLAGGQTCREPRDYSDVPELLWAESQQAWSLLTPEGSF